MNDLKANDFLHSMAKLKSNAMKGDFLSQISWIKKIVRDYGNTPPDHRGHLACGVANCLAKFEDECVSGYFRRSLPPFMVRSLIRDVNSHSIESHKRHLADLRIPFVSNKRYFDAIASLKNSGVFTERIRERKRVGFIFSSAVL